MNWREFGQFGSRVGRIGPIAIWVHWLLPLFLLFQLFSCYRVIDDAPFQTWLVFSLSLVITVLFHELGHSYAAFREGGDSDRIVLWPLGGLAYCNTPQDPGAHFRVAAAGPLVNFIFLVVTTVICLVAGWHVFPYTERAPFVFGKLLTQQMFLMNLFVLILNLIPCFPLDGGRMTHALLWSSSGSHGQALLTTLRISKITAILAIVAAVGLLIWRFIDPSFDYNHPLLSLLSWGFALAAVMYFSQARQTLEQLRYGEEESGIFGYDFSFGYTSLEQTATKERRPRASLVKRIKERYQKRAEARRREEEAEMRRRVDELLEKIHKEGMESLTRAEQQYLEKASKRLRESGD